MRIAVLTAALSLSLSSLATADPAAAAMRATHIAPQDLGSALRIFAADRHLQILYTTDTVANRRTSGAVGELTTDQALTRILQGTGLTFRYIDDETITLLPRDSAASAADPASSGGETTSVKESGGSASPSNSSSDGKEGKRSSSAGFRVAQAGHGMAPKSAAIEGQPPLQEIVVTAQKRKERLQDVPVPVTAIDTQALLNNNQVRLEDYYSTIPGLSMAPSDLRGGPILTIRGITTGSQLNPTVGITIDDVPYGSSTSLGGGFTVPDMDPSDLARIEVLRGPQGTLYGADSIGGLFKYVTIDPSVKALTGQVQVGSSSVQNGDGPGYSARGAVNVPISDTLAMRASGFFRRDPGYIDDPTLPRKGVNLADADGGRVSALWRPVDALSLKLTAMLQHSRADGLPYVTIGTGLGDLQQSALRGTNGNDKRFQVYSAVLNARLGPAQLTSVSGYSINTIDDSLDLTPAIGFVTAPYGAASVEHNRTSKLSQELRLSMPLGSSLDWLLGLFYTRESSQFMADIRAVDPTSGQAVTSEISETLPTTFTEYAVFTDFTLHFTDRFKIQLGGRESQNRQTYTETDIGPSVPLFDGAPSPQVFPEIHSKANSFTYLVTPQLRLSPDLMTYIRLASGYRAGGPNAPPGPGVPAQYQPDKTQNYELGVKGDTLAGKFGFDASLYYITWKDVQVLEFLPISGLGYIANAGRAKSQGIELELDARPLPGMKLSSWVAWNEAVLTQPFPANSLDYGAAGDPLPFSSRFSGNFSANEEIALPHDLQLELGGLVSYIGAREGVFAATAQRQSFPAYARTDLHAAIRDDSWTLSLFANNVTNRRGLLSGGLGTTDPNTFTFIQPRTLGLSLLKTF
jgi:iron complex outermembrane receptor protein